MNPTEERYTPGYCPTATEFMAARDLESHGFFLAPLLQPGFNVLDAGCGPATISTGIAEAIFPGHVTALDRCETQLETGRRLAQGREIVNINFTVAPANRLPFGDETFDLVFSHALLEHLQDPFGALWEMRRVTRPGGFIAVCSPDWDAFEIDPFPAPVRRAIEAYRGLQESNGGNTRAGALLARWIGEAGFTALAHDEWIEEYDSAARIARYLAVQLRAAGLTTEGATLRQWAEIPGARFRQSWKYATGVRE